MKKIISILLIIFLLTSTSVTAFASNNSVKGAGFSPSLSFSGTTANCYLRVTQSGANVSITLTLSEGTSTIASWSSSGYHYATISQSATVQPGHTYTLSGTATANGVSITIDPVTGTCP